MDRQDNKTPIVEIAGVMTLVIGLAVGVCAWWSGETLWSSGMFAFLAFIAGGLIMLVVEGFHTGKLGVKGGDIYREKNQIAFWGFVIFYVVVAVVVFFGFVVGFLFSE